MFSINYRSFSIYFVRFLSERLCSKTVCSRKWYLLLILNLLKKIVSSVHFLFLFSFVKKTIQVVHIIIRFFLNNTIVYIKFCSFLKMKPISTPTYFTKYVLAEINHGSGFPTGVSTKVWPGKNVTGIFSSHI